MNFDFWMSSSALWRLFMENNSTRNTKPRDRTQKCINFKPTQKIFEKAFSIEGFFVLFGFGSIMRRTLSRSVNPLRNKNNVCIKIFGEMFKGNLGWKTKAFSLRKLTLLRARSLSWKLTRIFNLSFLIIMSSFVGRKIKLFFTISMKIFKFTESAKL